MKFCTENIASAAEISSARQSAARTTTIAKVVIWTSALVLLALVFPFGKWFAGQLPPPAPDSDSTSAFVWVVQTGILVVAACLTFIFAGLSLARWPFAQAIELNQALQPLDEFEARNLLKIVEAYPELGEYRRSVAAVREFVRGDFELICDLEKKAVKIAQEQARAKQRQEIFDKLHSVE